MMKRTKFLNFILAAGMCFGMSACGSAGSSETAAKETATPAETAEPDVTAAPSPAETEEPLVFRGTASLDEAVLLDEADIRILLRNLECDDRRVSYEIAFENNTDRKLTFKSGTEWTNPMSVNRYMLNSSSNTFLMESVEPGAQSTEHMDFMTEDLLAYGITDIAEMEFRFNITDDSGDEYLRTGPLKAETSAAGGYDFTGDTYLKSVQEGNPAEWMGEPVVNVVSGNYFEAEGVRVISAAVTADDIVFVEAENTSDQAQILSYDMLAVNHVNFPKAMGDVNLLLLNPHSRGFFRIRPAALHASEADDFGVGSIADLSFYAAVMDENREELTGQTYTDILLATGVPETDMSGEELYSNNGIRLILKGTAENEDFFYVLLTAVNEREEPVYLYNDVRMEGLSVYVNGVQTVFGNDDFELKVAPGNAGAIEYSIDKVNSTISLENIGIAPEDIHTVDMTLAVAEGTKENVIDMASFTARLKEE